jgi:nucleoside-diphosphate-sugar epimerase
MAGKGERTVLLTGASGVVGRAVAEELRDEYVIGLAHTDTNVPEVDELTQCDLASPRLGLGAERWAELAERTDAIVHAGALTLWGQPYERYRTINVEGTRRVIELARLAAAPVYMIGSSFVRAFELRQLAELSDENVVKPYIWSKRESELLLVASGVPHTIFRPTNLVGNSRTGASSRPQIVQVISDWICRGKAPYFPAHPGNLVDVAPLDLLAVAIARAIELEDIGSDYWVTYGHHAMTVGDALEIIVEHARTLGREIERAPIVDPSRPLPIPLELVPAISRRFLKVLMDISEVTSACGRGLPTSLGDLRRRLGVPAASSAEAYRLSLAYWASQRGGAGRHLRTVR